MFTVQDSAASGVSLLDYPAPAGRVIRGAFDEALETNPIPLWMMSAEVNHARTIGPIMPKADAEQQATMAGVKVKVPDDGISQGALSLLIERRRDEAARQILFARREGAGAAIGSFAASLAGTLFDPLNVAAGFIPVLGGTRYEQLLEKAVGAGGRAGVRAGTGLAEGAVGAAVVEAPTQALRRDLQDDYSLYDSLANIAFGTLASGGLRVAGGAAKDVWMATRRLREIQQQHLQDIMPGLERSMREDLEQGFARGAGIPPDMVDDFRGARMQTDIERGAAADAERGAEQRAERMAAVDERVGQQTMRYSKAEIDGFIAAEKNLRERALDRVELTPDVIPMGEQHTPGRRMSADDRVLLDAAGVANRKFAEMDLKEVRERLERGEGLIIQPGNPREVLQAISDDTHAQALKAAVAQAVQGQRIDVDAVVRQDPVFGQQRVGIEVVRSRARSQAEPENLVGADKQASQAADKTIETGPPKAPEAPAAQAQGAPGSAAGEPKAPGATAGADAVGAKPAKAAQAIDAALQKAGPVVFRDMAQAHLEAKLAEKGEPLKPKEIEAELGVLAKEVAEGKHDAAIERAQLLARGNDEWVAIADELRDVGLPATRENVLDTDAVARASSIDEAAVERAAQVHEADDVAFMAAVREILGEADKNAEAARSRPAPESKARGKAAAAAGETRTGPRGLEDPEIRATIRSIADHESGWAQVGGQLDLARLIKENGPEAVDEFGRPTKLGTVAFTEWIPNAEWWRERPDSKMNARDYERAVTKALKGEKLKKMEQRAIDFLVDMANERLGLHAELGERVPPHPTPAELPSNPQNGKPFTSIRQIEAYVERTRTEQAKRAALLGDDAALAEYAEGRAPVDEMRTTLKENQAGNAKALADLEEFIASPEASALRASEKEGAAQVKFKDVPSEQIQEAEALLAETRQNAEQAAAEAGTQAPAPSTERAKADEYEKAYKAIGDCAPKEGQ